MMFVRWSIRCLLFASTASAQAQPATASDGPSLLPLVIVLVLVLALIPLAVWLLKRLGGGAPASVAGLRVIAQLPLGPRERVVIVEAGDRWLVLGVTAASINRIGTLPKGEAPATPANFASLLSTARDRWVNK